MGCKKTNKKIVLRRMISLLFAALFIFQCFQIVSFADTYSYTWCEDLINSVELHPQKTGFTALDNRVSALISGFKKNASTGFELLQACYDWLVRNVTYDRSLVYYPYYDFASKYKCPVPFYAIYFAYEPLFKYEGVCDNFASAFMIMARAIGFDSYLKTGYMTWSAGTTSHTWCEIEIDGVSYIFDPQADNSTYKSRGREIHWYFGRPASQMASTYSYNSSLTAKFREGTTSVTASRSAEYCFIKYSVGGNGTVSSGGVSESSAQLAARVALWTNGNYSHQFSGYLSTTGCASIGASVKLTATPKSGASFLGWYVSNKLVSTNTVYTFTAKNDVTVEALFSGERFNDVASGTWYHDAVYYCFKNSLMSGTSITKFEPDTVLTRSMAVTILAKMVNADVSSYTDVSFADVKKGSWYAPYVEWAKDVGITAGTSDTLFSPEGKVTREQLAVFFNALARYKNYGHISNADLSKFSDADQIHSWALNAMRWAYVKGILAGNTEGRIMPLEYATRAQTAVMVKKFRAG